MQIFYLDKIEDLIFVRPPFLNGTHVIVISAYMHLHFSDSVRNRIKKSKREAAAATGFQPQKDLPAFFCLENSSMGRNILRN